MSDNDRWTRRGLLKLLGFGSAAVVAAPAIAEAAKAEVPPLRYVTYNPPITDEERARLLESLSAEPSHLAVGPRMYLCDPSGSAYEHDKAFEDECEYDLTPQPVAIDPSTYPRVRVRVGDSRTGYAEHEFQAVAPLLLGDLVGLNAEGKARLASRDNVYVGVCVEYIPEPPPRFDWLTELDEQGWPRSRSGEFVPLSPRIVHTPQSHSECLRRAAREDDEE